VFSTGTISPTGNYGWNLAVNLLIPFQLGRSKMFVGSFCSIHLVAPPGCRSFAMHFVFNSSKLSGNDVGMSVVCFNNAAWSTILIEICIPFHSQWIACDCAWAGNDLLKLPWGGCDLVFKYLRTRVCANFCLIPVTSFACYGKYSLKTMSIIHSACSTYPNQNWSISKREKWIFNCKWILLPVDWFFFTLTL